MIINAHPATEATPVGFIPPQLLGTARAIPESPGWLYERKFDGYRANVILDGAPARIFTRGILMGGAAAQLVRRWIIGGAAAQLVRRWSG